MEEEDVQIRKRTKQGSSRNPAHEETSTEMKVKESEEVEKSLLYQVAKGSKNEEEMAQSRTARSHLIASFLPSISTPNTNRIKTSWKPFSTYMRDNSESRLDRLREKHGIVVEGNDKPPVMTRFKDMRLPGAVLEYLEKRKGIVTPTEIQMQGIPAALSGRDIIGIAYTGSGKSLAFVLPLVLFAIEAEERLEFVSAEGPVGLVVVPSRELAKQIHEQMVEMADFLARRKYYQVRCALCIGGVAMGEQAQVLAKGVHLIVATPGRLLDLLEKGIINLEACRHFCLDEADRMVDLGFEEELRRILAFFRGPRQTLLFSATMPAAIKDFARAALCNPILVNVGRAGAACKRILQTVEWIPHEGDRLAALLDALQKTAPPVVIFSQNKFDVDDVQEHLLRQGVEAVAIHGGKTQEERTYAIESFKTGQADVLVATDIASKGLDLPGIQHVINYDMPPEIEDYVHRIGRTGRGGRTGVATTFITPLCTGPILEDLKALLREAGQKVPAFLLRGDDADAIIGEGCAVCGGLGHTEANCPKLMFQTSKAVSQSKGMLEFD